MDKSQSKRQNRIPKSELEELLNDGKESKYWSAKPKPRRYTIENERAEEYYDNLVLEALKKHDNIVDKNLEIKFVSKNIVLINKKKRKIRRKKFYKKKVIK